jgi:hypothetical protein
MDQIFEKNLISTKDAGELSGYSSDYLARLARSGKIDGKRIGHSWFIDKDSLASFLDQQGNRKIDYARALARAREAEYREQHSILRNTAKTLSKPIQIRIPLSNIVENALRSQAFAFSVAFIVVAFGAFVTHADVMPQLADRAIAIAQETAFGFNATFGNIPSNIAAELNATSANMRTFSPRIAEHTELSFARMASSSPFNQNLLSLRMPFVVTESHNVFYIQYPAITLAPTTSANTPTLTLADEQSFLLSIYAFISTPSRIANALADAYTAVGSDSYASIVASFAEYQSFIEQSGIKTLALAASARDIFATAPNFVSQINLAIGDSIIEGTHAAIRTDVSASYGISFAAPATGHEALALIFGTGNELAGATAQTTAQAPATLALALRSFSEAGPALAQSFFGAEYAGAYRFIAISNAVSGQYLAAISNTGNFGESEISFIHSTSLALHNFAASTSSLARRWRETEPAAVEDAYLGALGKSALALNNFVEEVPALRELGEAGIAAAPTLSNGEQVAVVAYQTINTLFNSATSALAYLFEPPSTIVTPSSPAGGLNMHSVAVSATTTQNISHIAVTNYPTYTTVVNGVSQDSVNQSLATLRNNILGTVAGMIQPVAAQTATNETTIQEVNMIQDLSNLTVNNGNFLGGTLSGATSVSASNGSFGSLTVGGVAITGTIATTTGIAYGGTGLSIAPAYGQLLMGDGNGNYALTATSSLGINSGIWGKISGVLSDQTDLQSALDAKLSLADWFATTSAPQLTTLAGLSLPVGQITGISGTYPVQYSSGAISLAFGTTTPNTWAGTQSFAGNVGIGAAVPSEKLEVNGAIHLDSSTPNSTSLALYNNAGTLTWNGSALAVGSSVSGAANYIPFFTGPSSLGDSIIYQSGGNIGIGSTTPNWTLSINSAGNGFAVNSSGAIVQGSYAASAIGDSYISSAATWNAKQNAISVTYPVTLSGAAIGLAFSTTTNQSWSGTNTFTTLPVLASLSGLIAGNSGSLYQTASSTLYGTGAGGQVLAWNNGVPQWVATSSINNGVTSIIAGAGLNGGTITSTGTLSLASYIATSSSETAGYLPYWTSTNGTPATLGKVATTTLTGNNGLTLSAGAGALIGGSNATIGLTSIAANSILGTYAAGVPTAIATSSLFQNASALTAGLLTSGDWSTFNNKDSFAYPFINSATSSVITFTNAPILGSLSGLIAGNSGSLYQVASSSIFGFTPVSTSSPLTAGLLVQSTAWNTIANIATSSLNLATSSFASGNISQWVNDSGYLKSLAGAASSTLLTDANTFSGVNSFTNALSNFAGTWQGNSPSAFQTELAGATGQFPYFSGTNTLTATSSIYLSSKGYVGIGTTSPYANLSVMAGGNYASQALSTVFAIGSSTAGTATSTLMSINSAGQLLLPLIGSNISPTLAIGTSNTGFYSTIAGSNIQIAINGTQMATYNSVGVSTLGFALTNISSAVSGVFNNGTTGRVGWGPTSSTFDVGLSRYGAGILAVGNGTASDYSGTLIAGNVGIATTSPFAQLSIAGSAGGSTPLFAISTSTSGYATSTALTIDKNGNLSLLNGAGLSVSGAASFTNAPILASLSGLIAGNSGTLYSVASTSLFGFTPVSTSSPLTAGLLVQSTAWNTIANIATSTLNLATSSFASGNISQWVNDSSYLTPSVFNTSFDNRLSATTSLPNITTLAGLTSAGTFTGLIAGNSGSLYQVASSSIFGFTPISNSLAAGNFIVGNNSGTAQATSSIFITPTGLFGIGTTSPEWATQIASTYSATNPQGATLALSDTGAGANLKHWLLTSMGGSFYIGTSSDAYATSTPAALSISNSGTVTLASALGSGSGGTGTTTEYTGGVVFGNSAMFTQSNNSGNGIFYWDNTNYRLGIGTSSPWAQLSINPNGITGPSFVIGSSSATNLIVTNGGLVGIGRERFQS